jgi:hypothetical protein
MRRHFASVFLAVLLAPALAFASPSHPVASHGGTDPLVIVGSIVGGLAFFGLVWWLIGRSQRSMAGDFQKEWNKELEKRIGPRPKDPSAEPGFVPSVWKEKMNAAAREAGKTLDFLWFPDVPQARALIRGMLSEVAGKLGSGHVKENPNEDAIELRGTYAGAPFRFVVNTFGSIGDVEMQCENRVGPFVVHRDMDKVPVPVDPNDPNDPWAKEDVQRVFLAKGVFMEGQGDVESKLSAWRGVPAETQAAILAEVERQDVNVGATPTGVTVAGLGLLQYMDDPVTTCVSAAKLLELLKTGVSRGDYMAGAGGSAASPGGPTEKLTCKYCRSVFVFALGKSACPNCGANATA